MNADNNHLALSEEVNAAFAGLATLPDQVSSTLLDKSTASAPTTAAGGVRWLSDRKREEVYELQFPFELAGVEYRKITVRRLSAGEVDAFVKKMREAKSAEAVRIPMYFVGEAEITDIIWDSLDDDDVHGLESAAVKLSPARFRLAAG